MLNVKFLIAFWNWLIVNIGGNVQQWVNLWAMSGKKVWPPFKIKKSGQFLNNFDSDRVKNQNFVNKGYVVNLSVQKDSHFYVDKIENHLQPDCLLCHQKTFTILRISVPSQGLNIVDTVCFFLNFQFGVATADCIGNESIQLLQAALLASNST